MANKKGGSTYRLVTLGRVDLLKPDGGQAKSILAQPKRFALLIRLAAERGGFVSSEALVDAVWPRGDSRKAPGSLHVAISALRTSLTSKHAIVHVDALGYALSTDHLSWDGAAFLDAIESGDHAAALDLYPGDFLDNFKVDGCPNFEHWIDERQMVLRGHAVDAAMALLGTDRPRNTDRAIDAARRLLELDPYHEDAVRRAASFLAKTSDRRRAIGGLKVMIERLEESEITPSPETVELYDALRSRPTPVAPIGAPEVPSPPSRPSPMDDEPTVPVATVEPLHQPFPHRKVIGWGSVAVASVALVALGLSNRSSDATPLQADAALRNMHVWVETIEDFGSPIPGADGFAAAVTSETLAGLAGISSLPVSLTEKGRRPEPDDDPALILRAGMASHDGRLRVTALLLDATSNVVLDRHQFELGAREDLLDLSSEISASLSNFVRTAAGGWLDNRALNRSGATEPALHHLRGAIDARARGDTYARNRSEEAAIAMFHVTDSLLALAAAEAPDWPVPLVERAETALSRIWLYLPSIDPALFTKGEEER